jgi:hypothetical protein
MNYLHEKARLEQELKEFERKMDDETIVSGKRQSIIRSYRFQFKEQVQLYLILKILELEVKINPKIEKETAIIR